MIKADDNVFALQWQLFIFVCITIAIQIPHNVVLYGIQEA